MVATLAGVAAAVVGATPRSMLDAGAIQAAVAAADDRSIIMAWKSLSLSGVDRPPTREEQSLLRVARFRRGAATGLMVVGFVGGLMAIGGVIALATTRKESA